MQKENDALIVNNIRLIYKALKVLNMYDSYSIDNYYDIGMLGLVKGAKQYDKSTGYSESTFLTRCIINEILQQKRRENRQKRIKTNALISLDTIVYDNIVLEDTIKADIDIEKEFELKEDIRSLYNSIMKLSEKEQLVIIYTFGLFNKPKLTQDEIAMMIKEPQGSISRIKSKALKKIKMLIVEGENEF